MGAGLNGHVTSVQRPRARPLLRSAASKHFAPFLLCFGALQRQDRHPSTRFVFLQEAHMIRFALAVAVALCLSPVRLYAQGPRFTVTETSASVYQAPNAGSRVIAQSPKGAVLDVRAEAADWVEVAWP